VIILNERHLKRLMSSYLLYYHEDRTHLGLAKHNAFCTRLSWVSPDAVIQRAMRHTSPETKCRYQLGMVEQVREAMERASQQVYGTSASIN
jgi:hypothetical protein